MSRVRISATPRSLFTLLRIVSVSAYGAVWVTLLMVDCDGVQS